MPKKQPCVMAFADKDSSIKAALEEAIIRRQQKFPYESVSLSAMIRMAVLAGLPAIMADCNKE